MNNGIISRKELRQANPNPSYRRFKKGAAVVGMTMVSCSIAAPLMQSFEVEAAAATVNSAVNTTAFIAQVSSQAQAVANQNDLYASVMIAQAIVESGWGASTLSKAPNYNLFGIKGSYNGQSVSMSTLEYLNNQWVSMPQPFRKYPSFYESFADNAYVLRNVKFSGVYYYAGTWKSNTTSYRDATKALTGRYATDPSYNTKLNSIIEKYGLTRYDTAATGNAGGGATTGNTTGSSSTGSTGSAGSSTNTATGTKYTVKSGDSVWKISNQYGISMSDFVSWNNIKNNFIYPGQVVIVAKSATGGATTGNTAGSSSTGSTGSAGSSTNTATGTKYTVKSGDSVWKISNQYGISMSDFVSWNNIKNNFIYPGQVVIVAKSAAGGTTTGNTTGSSSTGSTSSSTNTATGTKYTVKSGDSVWKIANQYGISMDDFRSWNNIKNDYIYPGQTVIVAKGASTTAATSVSGTKYTVKSGDSVWKIANQHGITMDQLIKWNNIQNNFVYPGQQLKIAA